MASEEMKRNMEFIVEHQARLTVRQEQAEERITQLEISMNEMAQAEARTWAAQEQLIRAQERLNEVVAAMHERQNRTDERLDTFIAVLERYISERRNGKSE